MDALPRDLYELGLVAGVLEDPRFLTTYSRALEPEYVASGPGRWLVAEARSYFETHAALPPTVHLAETMRRQQAQGAMSDANAAALIEYCSRLTVPLADREYVFTTLPEFCQRQAMASALEDAGRYLLTGRLTDIREAIDSALRVADSGTALHHELFRQGHEWLAANHENAVPYVVTGLPELDANIGGGLRKGELGVWLAPTNRGKSHALVWCGWQAALWGRHVLHVTLELTAAMTYARYAAAVLEVPSDMIYELGEEVAHRLQQVAATTPNLGGIYPAGYPSRTLSIGDLRALYRKYHDQGIPIDVIVVDHGDLLQPPRQVTDQNWIVQGQVFEALRGLAAELEVPIWTATQGNRGSLTKDEIGLADIGESYEKAKPADVIIAMDQTESDRIQSAGQAEMKMTLSPRKVRAARVGQPVPVWANWAYSHLRLRAETLPTRPAWADFSAGGGPGGVPNYPTPGLDSSDVPF